MLGKEKISPLVYWTSYLQWCARLLFIIWYLFKLKIYILMFPVLYLSNCGYPILTKNSSNKDCYWWLIMNASHLQNQSLDSWKWLVLKCICRKESLQWQPFSSGREQFICRCWLIFKTSLEQLLILSYNQRAERSITSNLKVLTSAWRHHDMWYCLAT